MWGYGSVGRASRSQCEGQGFESPYLHHGVRLALWSHKKGAQGSRSFSVAPCDFAAPCISIMGVRNDVAFRSLCSLHSLGYAETNPLISTIGRLHYLVSAFAEGTGASATKESVLKAHSFLPFL